MKKMILLSCLVALTTSCATITKGGDRNVAINTNPPGALVTIDGQQKISPAVFALKGASAGYVVTAEKPGYGKTTDKVKSEFRGVPTILGNILWLVPGLVVDFVTGAAFDLEGNKTINLNNQQFTNQAVPVPAVQQIPAQQMQPVR